MKPRNENDPYSKGMSSFEKLDYKEAVNYFTIAIENNNKDSQSYLQRARVNFHLEQYQIALADCQCALQLESESEKQELYYLLGCIYYMGLDDDKAALDNFNSAVQFLEKKAVLNATYYYERGLTNSNLGFVEAAIIDFEKSVTINSVNKDRVGILGDEYSTHGDKFNAFRCLIRKLSLELKEKGGLTDELIKYYNKHLARYHAKPILKMVNDLPCLEAVLMLERGNKNGSLIRQYYPPESASAAFYFKLATELKCHVFFKYKAIYIFLKVILTELKDTENSAEFTERAFDELVKMCTRSNVGGVIGNLEYEDALLLYEKSKDSQTTFGSLCLDTDINTIAHGVNYMTFMRQPESVRLSSSSLAVLFAPKYQDERCLQDPSLGEKFKL